MTKPISTLRRHMIEDMKMRNMSPNSQKVYLGRPTSLRNFMDNSCSS
jgi:hypothetical protein